MIVLCFKVQLLAFLYSGGDHFNHKGFYRSQPVFHTLSIVASIIFVPCGVSRCLNNWKLSEPLRWMFGIANSMSESIPMPTSSVCKLELAEFGRWRSQSLLFLHLDANEERFSRSHQRDRRRPKLLQPVASGAQPFWGSFCHQRNVDLSGPAKRNRRCGCFVALLGPVSWERSERQGPRRDRLLLGRKRWELSH